MSLLARSKFTQTRSAVITAVVLLAATPQLAAQDEAQNRRLDALEREVAELQRADVDDERERSTESDLNDSFVRGGSLRVGAFVIDNIKTQLYFGPDDLPLGARLNLDEDLGFKDSLAAFRLNFSYRFSERHGLTAGYYNFSTDGLRRLSRTIEIGDTEFDVGLDVVSRYEEKVFKVAYNYIFHDDGKVMLAVTPGIHFSEADFRIGARTGPFTPPPEESSSTTTPLPMFGGRLQYQITPKLSMFVLADIFFLTQSDQEGALTDSHLLFEHQTFDRVALGAGLNRWSLDLELHDSSEIWDWQSVYTGAYLYLKVRF